MPLSAMLRRVTLVRTEFSVERIASIIRETKIGGLDSGGDTLLRNYGFYKSRSA
jgi:hypothetical protein